MIDNYLESGWVRVEVRVRVGEGDGVGWLGCVRVTVHQDLVFTLTLTHPLDRLLIPDGPESRRM